MPAYHSIKTIFVRVPKTACTSMCEKLDSLDSFARYFTTYHDKERPKLILSVAKHEGISEIKENMLIDHFNDYYKVAFVRNPWDWLVSYYSYYKKISSITDGGDAGHRRLLNLSGGAIRLNECAVAQLGEKAEEIKNIDDISFEDFLLLVESESEFYKKGANLSQLHYQYQPQYKYLVDKDENLIMDFVGKYENLDNDWKHLCERLEPISDRFKLNNLSRRNSSEHLDYRYYYNDSDAEKVYNIYRKDIELFDYSF